VISDHGQAAVTEREHQRPRTNVDPRPSPRQRIADGQRTADGQRITSGQRPVFSQRQQSREPLSDHAIHRATNVSRNSI